MEEVKTELYEKYNLCERKLVRVFTSFYRLEKLILSQPREVKHHGILRAKQYLLLLEEEYQKKKLVDERKEKIFAELKYCEKLFLEYIESFLIFESKVREYSLEQLNSRVISSYFSSLRKLNEEFIFHLTSFKDFTAQEYYSKERVLLVLRKQMFSKFVYITNNVIESIQYYRELSLKDLKKVNVKFLKVGDILVLRKKDPQLSSFRKFAKHMIRSNFIHTSLVYNIDGSNIFVFQSLAYNDKKTEISLLEIKKGYEYIVMRPQKPLSKSQIQKIKKLEIEALDIKYNYLKVLQAFFWRNLEHLLRKFSFWKKRPFNYSRKSRKVFCSEVVSLIYEKIGLDLGLSEDKSQVSPTDILNSSELKILGYLDIENLDKIYNKTIHK